MLQYFSPKWYGLVGMESNLQKLNSTRTTQKLNKYSVQSKENKFIKMKKYHALPNISFIQVITRNK